MENITYYFSVYIYPKKGELLNMKFNPLKEKGLPLEFALNSWLTVAPFNWNREVRRGSSCCSGRIRVCSSHVEFEMPTGRRCRDLK